MQATKTNYWPQLDGLRTIAFLLVLFHHHGGLPAAVPSLPAVQTAINKVSEWGWLGVDLFFILSAFLVTHLLCAEREIYGKISLPKFYARRALRIWPLFFLLLTVTCFIYPLFAPHKASHLYAVFVKELVIPLYTFTGNFALPLHFGAMSDYAKASGLEFMAFVTILTPFWSLCVEEQFYLLWGATARLLNNTKRLMVCAAVLMAAGCAARFFLLTWNREQIADSYYYMHSLWHLETIMGGAFLAILFLTKPQIARPLESGWLPPLLFAGSLATYLGVVVYGPSIHSWSYLLAPMMTALSIAGCTMLALAIHWQPLTKALSTKWMMQIGKLTFGMYVFHFFVAWLLKKTFNLGLAGWDGVWSLTLCFGVTLVAALISWNVLEKPMNDLRKKLSRVHGEASYAAATEAASQKQSSTTHANEPVLSSRQ